MSLEKLFADSAVAKILDILWEYQDIDITLNDISDETGVDCAILMKTLPELEKMGFVKTRQAGSVKEYQINKDDLVTKKLIDFLNSLNTRIPEN
jgi:DNA-binding IscR family transcriptional regulator